VEGPAPSGRTSRDAALFELAARLLGADQAHAAAMTKLARAEQRFAAMAAPKKRGRRRPAWLAAAQERETATGDALEVIYYQIAQTPARTKAGLAIKLRLVALLYGETVDEPCQEGDPDLVARLLRSLMSDVADRR
jgi:hypothetical protein